VNVSIATKWCNAGIVGGNVDRKAHIFAVQYVPHGFIKDGKPGCKAALCPVSKRRCQQHCKPCQSNKGYYCSFDFLLNLPVFLGECNLPWNCAVPLICTRNWHQSFLQIREETIFVMTVLTYFWFMFNRPDSKLIQVRSGPGGRSFGGCCNRLLSSAHLVKVQCQVLNR